MKIIITISIFVLLMMSNTSVMAQISQTQNVTNNNTSSTTMGKNDILIKIHTDNMTSWSASIITGPGGILNGSYTNINGIGDRHFLVACPYGRYDVEIGIEAAAESTPSLTISAIFAGHVINSQHVSLVCGMHQVPNGKFSFVGGKFHQLTNSTNIAEVSGACP
jgi:hypothetical protein